jgi:hypothetical protein
MLTKSLIGFCIFTVISGGLLLERAAEAGCGDSPRTNCRFVHSNGNRCRTYYASNLNDPLIRET